MKDFAAENNIRSKDSIQEFFENFNIKLFYYIGRKSMIFIALLALLCFLVPFLYIRYSLPIFETKAILIKKKEIKNSLVDEKSTEFLKSNDEEKINRDIQIIKSDLLLTKIADSLQLSISYYKMGRLPGNKIEVNPEATFELSNFKIYNADLYNNPITISLFPTNYSITYIANGISNTYQNIPYGQPYQNRDLSIVNHLNDKNVQGDYSVVFNDIDNIKNFIVNNVNITAQLPNIIFNIHSTNYKKSEIVLQKLISGFLAMDQQENSEKLENSIAYINNYIDTLNRQLKLSQVEKANYAINNQIFDPSTQLSSNLQLLNQYSSRIDELNQKIYSIDKIKNSTSSVIVSDPGLQILINEKSRMLLDYQPTHPTIVSINQQIENKVHELNKNLKNEISSYQFNIGQLKQKLSESQSVVNSIPNKDIEFSKIEKEVNIKEKYIIDLLERQIQYLIVKSSIGSDYLVIQSPKTKAQQISPKKSLLYSVGLISFFLLSLMIVVIRYLRFDKIVSIEEVKQKTNIPILGYVPFVEEAADTVNKHRSAPESRLVVVNAPKSRTSEVFKKIRTSLKYTNKGEYKTVASTSTISGEGKTFILINLAAVHALLNKKVLIIDLDLRKPRISKSFKLPNHVGMSTLLTSDISIDECIQRGIEIPNLDVITSGPIPPNPSELIISEKFETILEELKKQYDYIFIDTPPVGLVNESIELINLVDIPLYLIKFNYSKKEFLNTLNDIAKLKVHNTLYLIINHFGDGASNYVNYNYGYNYQYDYGKNINDKHEGYYTEIQKILKKPKFQKIKDIIDWTL